MDLTEAKDRVGGDWELLKELAQIFLDHCPEMMLGIRQAVESSDAEALERSAHSMKGSAGNFGAKDVVQKALVLETMGREKHIEGASDVLAELELETEKLKEALIEAISFEEEPGKGSA